MHKIENYRNKFIHVPSYDEFTKKINHKTNQKLFEDNPENKMRFILCKGYDIKIDENNYSKYQLQKDNYDIIKELFSYYEINPTDDLKGVLDLLEMKYKDVAAELFFNSSNYKKLIKEEMFKEYDIVIQKKTGFSMSSKEGMIYLLSN